MDRDIRCPVCRARIRLAEEHVQKECTCQICGTRFVLPLRRREAGDGESEPDS